MVTIGIKNCESSHKSDYRYILKNAANPQADTMSFASSQHHIYHSPVPTLTLTVIIYFYWVPENGP
jgi:hypothetical protein